MSTTMQKNYFDLLSLRMFIIDEFIKGRLSRKTLKKFIFSTEMLDEKEYKEFSEKRIGLPIEIPESGFSIPRLVMLERCLDRLFIFVDNGTFFVEDIYKIFFSDFHIKDGKIVG